jgi:hypothetical protein
MLKEDRLGKTVAQLRERNNGATDKYNECPEQGNDDH